MRRVASAVLPGLLAALLLAPALRSQAEKPVLLRIDKASIPRIPSAELSAVRAVQELRRSFIVSSPSDIAARLVRDVPGLDVLDADPDGRTYYLIHTPTSQDVEILERSRPWRQVEPGIALVRDEAFGTESRLFRRWTLANHLDHLYVCNGDRHWQYMSTDPETGLRGFSVGPSSDRHVLNGPRYQPKFHSFYREGGGFLSVSVSTGEQKVLARPQRVVFEKTVPTIIFRFHDVNGNLLYEYRDTALITQ